MKTKYVHTSLFKPREFVFGGVQVFSAYLKQAVPDLKLVAWSDYPMKDSYANNPDYAKAEVLNDWLLRQGIVDENTVVVTDGYWGYGLEGKVARLIPVCHGSYFGRFLRAQVHGWGEVVGMDHVEMQFQVFDDPNTEVVCVAKESERELHMAGIALGQTTVIYHGVDLDVYHPFELKPGNVWMHVATSARKGGDILEMVHQIDPSIDIEFMDERSGQAALKAARLNEARALIMPTRHEGSSYAAMEGLACGVPLIAFETGLALEMDERCGLFTDDLAPAQFIRMIRRFGEREYDPRTWAEENCSYETFAADWRDFLEYTE